ncbi:MAG: hypothetical protein AAFX09_09370 [Pseudomonadota bacterium]
MNATGRILLSALLLGLAACASAPISLGVQSNAAEAPAQAALAETTQQIVETAKVRAWRLTEAQAGGFLGRLISGAGNDAESSGPTAYLTALQERSGEASLDAITADIALATRFAADAAASSMQISADLSITDAAALDRDLAAAESGLSALRRARAVFEEAIAELDEAGVETATALGELDTEIHALAGAADSVAAKRWALRRGAVS